MPKRIAVLLSDEEYAQVCTQAGIVPLSAYFRALALKPGSSGLPPGSIVEVKDPQHPTQEEFEKAKKRRAHSTDPKAKYCGHGIHIGGMCSRCEIEGG